MVLEIKCSLDQNCREPLANPQIIHFPRKYRSCLSFSVLHCTSLQIFTLVNSKKKRNYKKCIVFRILDIEEIFIYQIWGRYQHFNSLLQNCYHLKPRQKEAQPGLHSPVYSLLFLSPNAQTNAAKIFCVVSLLQKLPKINRKYKKLLKKSRSIERNYRNCLNLPSDWQGQFLKLSSLAHFKHQKCLLREEQGQLPQFTLREKKNYREDRNKTVFPWQHCIKCSRGNSCFIPSQSLTGYYTEMHPRQSLS